MIWKILKKEFKPLQVFGVLFIMLLGYSIIVLTARFYFDIKPSFKSQDLWQHEHIIINKKISKSNTTAQLFGKGKKPSFSQIEINKIKKKAFVKDLAIFTSSNFEASAYTEGDQLGGFYTEIFFESVPSGYIDLNGKDWDWTINSDFIPIIIPKTYLNLYNFGFATAQNLPQINEEAAGAVPFKIIVKGNNKKDTYQARIAGFSDRLNTILVPQEFLDYANPKYGKNVVPVSRLIILTPDPSSPELLSFLQNNNYDYNKEQLNNGKARMLLNTATAIVIITGLILTILSLWLFILSSQLLLQKNSAKISKLKSLGFPVRQIIRPFININLSGGIIVFTLSFIPFYLITAAYRNSLKEVLIPSGIHDAIIIACGLLFITSLTVINISIVRHKLNKL